MTNQHKKAILIVLDSLGIGALPDAAEYGDGGACTLQRIADAMPHLELPYLNALGLHRLVPQFADRQKADIHLPCTAARMAELSRGKDTITGHWELAGIITEEPSPTFPDGFPDALLQQIYDACGVTFIGNEVASGTEIIARLGDAHVRTGKPILYTSADSVLQIAAHEDVVPLAELYGEVPKSAYDGYAIRLADTELYRYYDALKVLPKDTLILLPRNYLWGESADEESYAQFEALFRAIVEFKAP